MHGVVGAFDYRRCVDCGTVWQDPMVVEEDVPLLYAGDYYTREQRAPTPNPRATHPGSHPGGDAERATSTAPPSGGRARLRDEIVDRVRSPGSHASETGVPAPPRSPLGALAVRSRWMRERAFGDRVMDEMLPRRVTTARALDAGCGSGRLLTALASVGWAPEGLEPDPRAAELARARGDGPVHVGAIPMDLPEGPFDLVTMVHVFEHLSDPVEALRRVAATLSRSGRIVLVYPNPESLLARAWGADWYGWEIPRHLTLLPTGALAAAARAAGLRMTACRTTARWAPGLSAQSRALREGVKTVEDGLPARAPTLVDRGLAALERGAVALGVPVGEEIVARLEPARSRV